MENITVFETVNPHSAGIDLGSMDFFVSMDGITAHSYKTFTADYLKCIEDLKAKKIERIAMEATGVYWIAFYEMLENNGLEVCLVNPKETKQVPGRKTDVRDCKWIQKLFSAGLLRQSYIPKGKLKELRMLMREREDTIEVGSSYVNKMQKALELMNIKLTGVISQIHGVSGIKMIEAILKGERDPDHLLLFVIARLLSTNRKT
jgi:transposase